MNQYEAMFLFDPTSGGSFEACETEIRRLMDRAQAEILLCRQWDDRRLCYRIKGRKRGVYVLVYFMAPADRIGPLERDVQISEQVLRVLVLRADGLTLDMMEQTHARGTVPREEALAASDQEEPATSAGGTKSGAEPAAAKKSADDPAKQTDAKPADGTTKPADGANEPVATAGASVEPGGGPDAEPIPTASTAEAQAETPAIEPVEAKPKTESTDSA